MTSTDAQTAAKPFVHPLFSSHMVLQRGKELPIWGWADPGAKVTVAFGGSETSTSADDAGVWKTKIGPFEANASGRSMTVTRTGTETETIKLDDVLVGDVWICSGQSNMEWPVAASNNSQQEISAGDHAGIRLFTVPKRISVVPEETVDASWSECTTRSLPGFSAVGYFFGRELNQQLNVPIGLIHSSWGGTVAEAWTSANALRSMEDFVAQVDALQQTAKEMESGTFDLADHINAWWEKHDVGTQWAAVDTDDHAWSTMDLPSNWELANVGLDNFDGIVWFRKQFDLPPDWSGNDVVLSLGAIDDADTTWVNGHEVGGMDRWDAVREYRVAASLLKPGTNVIAVRVFDGSGGGGIYQADHEMTVRQAGDSGRAISLKGPWRFKAGPAASQLSPFPQGFSSNPNQVSVLYNGMLAPLRNFGITGAIWYQGESNAGRAEQYRQLLPTMIGDWRKQFGQEDFPFLVVQLANFMQQQDTPVQSGWAELREAQQITADRDHHVGLAVITDIGEADDIHPRNKQDVGKRLALQAMKIAYGQELVASGPTVKDLGIRGDAVVVDFANVGGGLMAKGEKLTGFAIAELEGDFVWADAKIDGDSVVLSNPTLAEPIRVRYNWGNNPIGNLFNREGLPAAPFRTDQR